MLLDLSLDVGESVLKYHALLLSQHLLRLWKRLLALLEVLEERSGWVGLREAKKRRLLLLNLLLLLILKRKQLHL